MKTINLSSVQIQEIRFRPNDSEPNLVVFYKVLDDADTVVGDKSYQINLTDLPNGVSNSLTNFLNRLTNNVEKDGGVMTLAEEIKADSTQVEEINL